MGKGKGGAGHGLGKIKNKQKRLEVLRKRRSKFEKESIKRAKEKKEAHGKNEGEGNSSSNAAPIVEPQYTLETLREGLETVVKGHDAEVSADVECDELSDIMNGVIAPKIMVTTRPRPSKQLFHFIRDLMSFLPNSYLYERKSYELKDMCKWAGNKKFTHLIVLGEKNKVCTNMLVVKLPEGPTAYFRVTNVVQSKDIADHGSLSQHFVPEVIMNNFKTRLGHRVGRILASMFPHQGEVTNRTVATIHNQRDFMFLRHHRYIFNDSGEKVNLQELGPRFTLKLKWVMADTFNTKHGEYEWVHNTKAQDGNRRKFAL